MKRSIYFLLISLFAFACGDDEKANENCKVSQLDFQSVTDFTSSGVSFSTGNLVADEANEVLYVTGRPGSNRHELISVNLKTNAVSTALDSSFSDYASRAAFFHSGSMHLLASSRLNTYDASTLAQASSKMTKPTDIGFYFGVAFDGSNTVYIAGGHDGGAIVNKFTNKLRKYDMSTNTVSDASGTFPNHLQSPGLVLHDGTVYAFGGSKGETVAEAVLLQEGYAYNLSTNTATAIPMPYGLKRGFVAKESNCIIVGGVTNDAQPKLGVYDVDKETYTDVPHNLAAGSDIHGITIVGEYLYIVYRNPAKPAGTYTIMRAQIS